MPITSQTDQLLQERFALREEVFEQNDWRVQMLLPKSSLDLLDEEAFERDERMPYWADLWPSAKALARWLLKQPRLNGRFIELGCGVGLPALAVKSRGGDVLATDFNEDALLFARLNSLRNGMGELDARLLDWRVPPSEIGKFDVVLAADVLYEQRNAIALVDLLPRILAPTGSFVLADPGRRWAGEFRKRMRQARWIDQELDLIEEPAHGAGAPSLIQITEWKPASSPQ